MQRIRCGEVALRLSVCQSPRDPSQSAGARWDWRLAGGTRLPTQRVSEIDQLLPHKWQPVSSVCGMSAYTK